jgi:uncharacterized protein (TIGR01244 family)
MRKELERFVVGVGLCAVAAYSAAAEVPAAADATVFPNYRLVRPGLAVAGQPSAKGLAQLKEMGFKTFVNLRPEKEGARDEEEVVRAAGLSYVSVPVTGATLSMADADAVSRVLDDPAAGPVLLHCASANRVGAIWALMQVRKGKSLDEAEAEGRALGLESPALVEAMRKVATANP